MQNQRSRTIWVVAIAVALFFFIDPFRIFTGRRVPTARVDNETRIEMAGFVSSAPSAADAVLDLLENSDVVLIGETGYASQQLTFAANLIPVLDSAGIRNFGYEYANREDQDLIDALVTGTTFDESLARRIIFNHLSVLGFQEYVEVFRAAWQVNRRKPAGEPPFRIVALSNRLNYDAITSEDDVKDPDVMRQVFASGIPDTVMAQIIEREFLQTGEKAVAYMQIPHAWTAFERPEYSQQLAELGFPGVRRAGAALRASYGNRVVTAALHGPVRYSRSRTGFGYPCGGVVDQAASSVAERGPVGFRVDSSPFADSTMFGDDLVDDNGAITLSEYADAYLVVAQLGNLTAVTPIEDFITEANIDEAIRNFPGVKPENATPAEMNEFIAGNASSMAEIFAKL